MVRKACDRNQYLLPSSIHPITVTNNIPFSLGLRIVRNCTEEEDRNKRILELKQILLSREYPERVIDNALQRALSIPRKLDLIGSHKKGPLHFIRFDPRLPSMPTIQAKHWRSMVSQDQYLADCFPRPPLTDFRRPNNLRELLVKVKVPPLPNQRPERRIKGMRKCGKG